MASEVARVASRNTPGQMRYFLREIPPDAGLVITGKVSPAEYRNRRHMATEAREVTVHDARTALPGGLQAWNLDTHGFCCFQPPPPVDFKDKKVVREEYFPKLAEIARRLTGAQKAYVWAQRTRDENPQSLGVAYSRFAHADGGPESPAMWRRVLMCQFGVPEAEARSCDIMMVNVWHPRERPAFKDPLCLLDCSSVDLSKDLVMTPYLSYTRNGEWRRSDGGKKILEMFWGKKAMAMPNATTEVPSNGNGLTGPIYSAKHRWVFCPDMRPDEAWIFKQWDTRPGVAAKSCWHDSFRDPFHAENPQAPGRRSTEFHLLLTFPKPAALREPEPPSPSSKL